MTPRWFVKGDWVLVLIETTLRAADSTLAEALPKFGNSLYIEGVLTLSQGFLLTSMAFAAIVAFSIDRRFVAAAVTSFVCAGLSATGLIHAYTLGPGGMEPVFGFLVRPDFVFAYALLGVALLGARWIKTG